MFEIIDIIWLDMLSYCLYEKSHSWVLGPMQNYLLKRAEDGCMVTIYRTSNTPIPVLILPELKNMPRIGLGDSEIIGLQTIAKWFFEEIKDCHRIDVQYQKHNVSYTESDKLPRN